MATRVPHEKVYGVAATRAVFERRMDDVHRIAFTAALSKALGPVLSEASKRRVAYEERTDEEIANIAGSVHHEGICVAVRPRKVHPLDTLLRERWRGAIAIDDVSNPHNVGAIVRSAAFFGIEALLVAGDPDRAPLTPSAVRVAQGGAEHVHVVRERELAPALRRLASSGVAVVGTDVRGKRALDDVRWPERTMIVLGSEGEGMSAAVRSACTELVTIPGSGAVESLNVGVAAGVMLATWARAMRA
ncbi:MAG: RNA methyltransferase [Myxococcota bacterium]|nr:RNA methyltransferase [Myxococcota bacterium]